MIGKPHWHLPTDGCRGYRLYDRSPEERRAQWMLRWRHDKCTYCGRTLSFPNHPTSTRGAKGYTPDPLEAQIDHVIPRSRGGGDERENLAPCCRTCNTRKGAKTAEEFEP